MTAIRDPWSDCVDISDVRMFAGFSHCLFLSENLPRVRFPTGAGGLFSIFAAAANA